MRLTHKTEWDVTPEIVVKLLCNLKCITFSLFINTATEGSAYVSHPLLFHTQLVMLYTCLTRPKANTPPKVQVIHTQVIH